MKETKEGQEQPGPSQSLCASVWVSQKLSLYQEQINHWVLGPPPHERRKESGFKVQTLLVQVSYTLLGTTCSTEPQPEKAQATQTYSAEDKPYFLHL